MTVSPDELLIVYNADGGIFSALADALHKVVSPATYPCSLCAMTYGPVAMRGRWRNFLARLPQTKRFYHRDDFAAAYPDSVVALPAILTRAPGHAPRLLVSAAELDAASGLEGLIEMMRVRLGSAAA